MDYKQECLWVCNTHWVMNSNEKAIMKFQCQTPYSSSTGFRHLVLKHKAPYPNLQDPLIQKTMGPNTHDKQDTVFRIIIASGM